MGVEVLVQIDRLVQLLETPVFNFLRLHLLHPARFPALLWCGTCSQAAIM
jgi:vacuole morphology and inheritance protein 14